MHRDILASILEFAAPASRIRVELKTHKEVEGLLIAVQPETLNILLQTQKSIIWVNSQIVEEIQIEDPAPNFEFHPSVKQLISTAEKILQGHKVEKMDTAEILARRDALVEFFQKAHTKAEVVAEGLKILSRVLIRPPFTKNDIQTTNSNIFRSISQRIDAFDAEYRPFSEQFSEKSASSNRSLSLTELLKSGYTDKFQEELKRRPEQIEAERDSGGLSLLSVACVLGDVDIASAILAQAPLLLNEPDKHGLTPLHYAVSGGFTHIVKLLLAEENIELDMETVDFADKQTGISVPMCGGLTPILMAAERGEREVFELLRSAGAYAQQKDNNENGILAISLFNGYLCIAEALGCEPLPTLPSQKRRNEWSTKQITKIRRRVMENDRNQLLDNIAEISRQFKPKNPDVYSFAENLSAEVFHPTFLKIMHYLEECEDAMLLSLLHEASPSVFHFPIFTPEFCSKFISELHHCADQSKQLNLPIRKANVRNSKGVVLNDFGFQDTLYRFMQDYIAPIANLLFPSRDRREWKFESNYTFSVEFEMGEDTDLVLHKDSSDITLNICLGTQFEGADVYFYNPDLTDPSSLTEDPIDCSFKVGYGMMHRGRHLHGTRQLTSGHRLNVVMWSRSWKNPTIDA